MPSSVSSLDSDHSVDSINSEEEDRIAQEEWEQSVQDIQRLFAAVLMPYLGKYFGRSFSYWAFSRYLRLGLSKSFFLGGF